MTQRTECVTLASMDADDRRELLDRAEALLPKYGGFAAGALNQAALLLGLPIPREEWDGLLRELEARAAVA